MRLDPERFSIVLVGAWNVSILNPDWVTTVLFDGEPIVIELLLGDLTWRFSSPMAVLEVGDQRVQLRSALRADADLADAAIEPLERLAIRLLEALPETPVRAVGINFGFQVAKGVAVAELDRPAGTSVAGAALRAVRIQETLDFAGRQVNVNLVREGFGSAEATIRVEVNHHDEVPPGIVRHRGKVASELLRGRTIAAKTLSLQIAEQRLPTALTPSTGG